MLRGGAGNDVLTGEAGRDHEYGDAGADTFDQGALADGADVLVGGLGADTVDYAGRRASVAANLNGLADDGAAGERDRIGVDVEALNGGSAADRLTGDARANTLRGNGGNDDCVVRVATTGCSAATATTASTVARAATFWTAEPVATRPGARRSWTSCCVSRCVARTRCPGAGALARTPTSANQSSTSGRISVPIRVGAIPDRSRTLQVARATRRQPIRRQDLLQAAGATGDEASSRAKSR